MKDKATIVAFFFRIRCLIGMGAYSPVLFLKKNISFMGSMI